MLLAAEHVWHYWIAIVMVLMSIELILNSVNINLLAFSLRHGGDPAGNTFALYVIAVAAAEVGVAEVGAAHAGLRARPVPIIESRVTRSARAASSRPSLPIGRCGITR